MKKPSILIMPPLRPWYMEAHAEYLIRYLSDEFFIEVADVPYPPYKDFLDRPETYPFQRNPDNYDLLMPLLSTHWVVTERDKYAHKMSIVMYEPGEGRHDGVAVVGCCTPVVEDDCKVPFHSLRWGIDTELFQPMRMGWNDDLLHVGMIGTITNPRRQIKEIESLFESIPGVKFDFYPTSWVNKGDIERSGGNKYLRNVVSGDKYWNGLPNIYNQMDVLLRIDNSYGYSFPTLEAAACGVPVITTYQGIDHLITDAGGGILLTPNEGGPRWPFNQEKELIDKVRKAIIWMRDNPSERLAMGINARQEVKANWGWENFIPAWREFFREGIKNAK
jgi:glycosyltransferase involved in cell wall biosynthesis